MPKVFSDKVDKKKRTRVWVLTCNNYTQDDIERTKILASKTRYSIYGLEVGENGTPHIQGYFCFKDARIWAVMNKALPRGIFRPAEGTALQNQVYCSKDGKFFETGTMPAQGKRTDITRFVDDVRDSLDVLDEGRLLEEYAGMIARYPTFVDRVQRHYHPPLPLKELKNVWYYGPPGTGKTTRASKLLDGDHYVKWPNKWHCGYARQKVIIVEDIGPEHAREMKHFLKLWADYAPYTAQTKCSSLFIRPEIIAVTSNYSIEDMGWDEVTTAAIKRRFHEELMDKPFNYEKVVKAEKVSE